MFLNHNTKSIDAVTTFTPTAVSGSVTGGDNYRIDFSLLVGTAAVEKNTKYVFNVPSDAIRYQTVKLDEDSSKYFTISNDSSAQTITLTVNEKITGGSVGDSKINGYIDMNIAYNTNTYDLTYQINKPNATPGDKEKLSTITVVNPPIGYGLTNYFWGIDNDNDGEFIGKRDPDDYSDKYYYDEVKGKYLGIFNRLLGQIDTFGQINAGFDHDMRQFVDKDQSKSLTARFYYKYDSTRPLVTDQELITNSIKLRIYDNNGSYKDVELTTPGVNVKYGDGYFDVNISDIDILTMNKGTDNETTKTRFQVNFSTNGKKQDGLYRSVIEAVQVENGNENPLNSFEIYSIFSQNGNSDFFPTLTAKDQRMHLNTINKQNASEKLIYIDDTSAYDTEDKDMNKDDIELDDSKVDYTKVGTYPVTYTIKNTRGNEDTITRMLTLYEPVFSKVTVKYVDKNNKELAQSITLDGEVDEEYKTSAKDITGYKLLKTPSNANGTFTEEEQTVIYVYEKQSVTPPTPVPPTPTPPNNKKPTPTNKTKHAIIKKKKKTNLPKTGTSLILVTTTLLAITSTFAYLRFNKLD